MSLRARSRNIKPLIAGAAALVALAVLVSSSGPAAQPCSDRMIVFKGGQQGAILGLT